jgi:hypothetical protein
MAVLEFIWYVLVQFFTYIWGILVGAFSVASKFFTIIIGFAIDALVIVGAVWALIVIAILFSRVTTHQLKVLLSQLTDLKLEFNNISRDMQIAARDAGFTAVIGAIAGLVAYLGNKDVFNESLTLVTLVGTFAISLCVAKLLMLMPVRISKIIGLTLTILIVAWAAMSFPLDKKIQACLSG